MNEEERLKIELEASNITIGLQVNAYKKLEQENKQLREINKQLQDELKHYKDMNMALLNTNNSYSYGIRANGIEGVKDE